MSLLSSANRLNTANQIKSWNDSAVNGMNQAKSAFQSISTQLESMRTNPEYTQEDIVEVETILSDIITIAKSLIPTE